jgi:hypothetical protein
LNEKLFIDKWINKVQSAEIKLFPLHFIDESQIEIILIPEKTLVIGREFFGAFEVITTDGESIYQASDYTEAKFFVYSSKERNGKAYLPKDRSLIKSLVGTYDDHLDNLLVQIKLDYKKYFPEGKNLKAISNVIFQKLNLIRY